MDLDYQFRPVGGLVLQAAGVQPADLHSYRQAEWLLSYRPTAMQIDKSCC